MRKLLKDATMDLTEVAGIESTNDGVFFEFLNASKGNQSFGEWHPKIGTGLPREPITPPCVRGIGSNGTKSRNNGANSCQPKFDEVVT